jgi:hypothetical protein
MSGTIKKSIFIFPRNARSYTRTFVFIKNTNFIYYIPKKYGGLCTLTKKSMTVIKTPQIIFYCNAMNGAVDTLRKMAFAAFFFAFGIS